MPSPNLRITRQRLRNKPTEKRADSFDEGLGLLTVRTQQEVADILGITRQAVREIERRALYKIRMRLKEFRELMEPPREPGHFLPRQFRDLLHD